MFAKTFHFVINRKLKFFVISETQEEACITSLPADFLDAKNDKSIPANKFN